VCTLALFWGTSENCPLLLAANRDEHYDRPSAAPQFLPGAPKILAGRDLRVGGTWLGVNQYGVVAGILNRRVNGDPLAPSRARSRGLLCLDLLTRKSAGDGRALLIAEDNHIYNPFTVVMADRNAAFIAYNNGRQIVTRSLERGLHAFSSAAEVDVHSSKGRRAQEKFAHAWDTAGTDGRAPTEWIAPLQQVLSDHSLDNGADDVGDAICVHRESSGTVSSSIIVYSQAGSRFEMFYCPGPPCQNSFEAPLFLEVRR